MSCPADSISKHPFYPLGLTFFIYSSALFSETGCEKEVDKVVQFSAEHSIDTYSLQESALTADHCRRKPPGLVGGSTNLWVKA